LRATNEQLAATHESSHAVLGLALGAELVSITLVPPLTVFGRSTIPLGELWAVRSLAGGEGERFFYPELRPDEIGDGIDLAKLQRTLGLGLAANLDRLRATTRALVAAHAGEIETVARALLVRGYMTGAEVAAEVAGGAARVHLQEGMLLFRRIS
jgi:hypothetical protein